MLECSIRVGIARKCRLGSPDLQVFVSLQDGDIVDEFKEITSGSSPPDSHLDIVEGLRHAQLESSRIDSAMARIGLCKC